MATYTSAQVLSGTVPINERGASFFVYGSISLTTALAANDVVQLMNVPNGYKVLNVTVDTDDLDSGASPALKFNLGDSGSATRYLSQSTLAQAGGVAYNNVAGSTGYVYPIATTGGNSGSSLIQLVCTTAAQTWANGTVRCAAEMQVDHASFA
ncbi:MAG TPA: hypothetical protein VF651_08375 [Gammaproteobacteria bacterium]